MFSNFDFDLITLRIEPFGNFEKKIFLVEKFSVEKFWSHGVIREDEVEGPQISLLT